MALLYAFTTRSILAKFLFQNQIELLMFYGITYLCLAVSFINAFDAEGNHLYAPIGFYSITILFIIITAGLHVAGNSYSLIYYGLALLVPFAVNEKIRESGFFANLLLSWQVFLLLGVLLTFCSHLCLRQFLYPCILVVRSKACQTLKN